MPSNLRFPGSASPDPRMIPMFEDVIGAVSGRSWLQDVLEDLGTPVHVGASPPATFDTGSIWLDTSSSGTGGVTLPLAEVSTNTLLTSSHVVVLVDATSGSVTITLPTAVGIAGKRYFVKKVDVTDNTVVIDGDGTDELDGSLTLTLTGPNETAHIVSNGTDWYVI